MSQPKPRPAQRTESLNAFSRRNFLSSWGFTPEPPKFPSPQF